MLQESCIEVSIAGRAWLQADFHDRREFTAKVADGGCWRQETDPDLVTTGTVARYLASRGTDSDPVAIDNVLLRLALAGKIASPQPGRWRIAA